MTLAPKTDLELYTSYAQAYVAEMERGINLAFLLVLIFIVGLWLWSEVQA